MWVGYGGRGERGIPHMRQHGRICFVQSFVFYVTLEVSQGLRFKKR